MLTIVVYHVDNPDRSMAARYHNWGGRYERMLATLACSARWADPHCRLVLCTDLNTRLDRTAPYEIFRRDRDHRIAIHRMETQAAFLRHQPPGRYVFVDTDVLINKDPSELFDFDVAVTAPSAERAKLNSGVVFVKIPDAGAEWFTGAAEALRSLSDEQQVWMGDQFAQEYLFYGEALVARPFGTQIVWQGHRVKLLSSGVANWSPMAKEGPEDGEEAVIWHLKGPRKSRLEEFYEHLEERLWHTEARDTDKATPPRAPAPHAVAEVPTAIPAR